MYVFADSKEPNPTRIAKRILLSLIVFASFVFLILWRTDNPQIERLRTALVDQLLPLVVWVNAPVEFSADMIRDYRNFLAVYDQNRQLRRDIQQLQALRERVWRLEGENARLHALNNIRLPTHTNFLTGRIIADGGGPFFQSALVDIGRSNGVADGSIAVDGNGVVGRVVGLGEHAARLLLLTDFSSRLPVVIRPSGDQGILVGDGTPAPVIRFLANKDRVRPGNLVETSGAGGLFPPNLPVGRLKETPDKDWRTTLATDYNRLEFVRLIRYQPDTRVDTR